MKKIFSYLFYVGIISMMIPACTPDDPVVTPSGPSVTIATENGFVSDHVTLDPNVGFKIKFSAVKGSATLKSLEIKADGVAIDFTKIKINGVAASSNPALLFNADKDGLSNFVVELTSTATPDTIVYQIKVVDDNGNSDVDEITVHVNTIEVKESQVLRMNNFSGPNQGGIDPINFLTVASANPAALFRDYGNNTQGDWAQLVSAINGSELKIPAAGFDYSKVKYQKEIEVAFKAGSDSPFGKDLDFKKYGVFLVNNGSNYFVVKITNIVVTPSDNFDYSELTIKK